MTPRPWVLLVLPQTTSLGSCQPIECPPPPQPKPQRRDCPLRGWAVFQDAACALNQRAVRRVQNKGSKRHRSPGEQAPGVCRGGPLDNATVVTALRLRPSPLPHSCPWGHFHNRLPPQSPVCLSGVSGAGEGDRATTGRVSEPAEGEGAAKAGGARPENARHRSGSWASWNASQPRG